MIVGLGFPRPFYLWPGVLLVWFVLAVKLRSCTV
nr:MAG TPA: hypothetical protein [Caudoviricetes sp.]